MNILLIIAGLYLLIGILTDTFLASIRYKAGIKSKSGTEQIKVILLWPVIWVIPLLVFGFHCSWGRLKYIPKLSEQIQQRIKTREEINGKRCR